MRIRGDAARLVIDGISWPSVALRAAMLLALGTWVLAIFRDTGSVPPVMLLVAALPAVLLRRAFTQRPHLVLDRAEGEMILSRAGEEIRRPLAGLRGARVQTYEPNPRMVGRTGRRGGRGLARMALVTDRGALPFEAAYRAPGRADRLAEAVNGWLGAELDESAPHA